MRKGIPEAREGRGRENINLKNREKETKKCAIKRSWEEREASRGPVGGGGTSHSAKRIRENSP